MSNRAALLRIPESNPFLIKRSAGDEAASCVLNGKQESEDMPLEETIAIMEVMVSDRSALSVIPVDFQAAVAGI